MLKLENHLGLILILIYFKKISNSFIISFLNNLFFFNRNEITPKSGLIRQREFLMAEIEHFLDPELKYKAYEKFIGDVENVKVNIFDEKAQINSLAPIKMRLRDAVNAVLFSFFLLLNYDIRLKQLSKENNQIRNSSILYQ